MEEIFSATGISVFDFIKFSTYFFITMLVFLGIKDKRYNWLNYLLIGAYALTWIISLVSHKPPATKLFATLLMMTIAIVEVVVMRKRKLRVK